MKYATSIFITDISLSLSIIAVYCHPDLSLCQGTVAKETRAISVLVFCSHLYRLDSLVLYIVHI